MKDHFDSSAERHERRETRGGGFAGRQQAKQGKVGWILLWLLGVPLPILFVLFLLRGCT